MMAEKEEGYQALYHIYSGLVLFSQNNENEPELKKCEFDLDKLIQDCAALIQEYEKSTLYTRLLAQQVRAQEKQLAAQAKQLSVQASKIEDILQTLRGNPLIRTLK